MIVEKSKQQLTVDQVNDFESRLGVTLPIDYKDFLLKYNGGYPRPNAFTFIDNFNKTSNSIVDFFHAIYEGYGEGNLEIDYDYFKSAKRIPPNVLPIAGDPFGNLICLSIEGEDKGKVYFWDHETEPQNASYENLSLIAGSFADFINILK